MFAKATLNYQSSNVLGDWAHSRNVLYNTLARRQLHQRQPVGQVQYILYTYIDGALDVLPSITLFTSCHPQHLDKWRHDEDLGGPNTGFWFCWTASHSPTFFPQ